MNSASGFFKWWGTGSFTPITMDYITRVTAEGGTLTQQEKVAINELTQNADIAEFDRLWVHGLSNQIAARISLVNALTADLLTEVNSPTWDSNGYQGNGTTMYLNTNYNPAVDGVKFTQDSAFFGVYKNILNSTVGSQGVFTTAGGDKYLLHYTGGGSTAIRPAVNDNDLASISDKLNALGSNSIVRTSSTNKIASVNGVDSAGLTNSSTGLPNGNVFLLARNADNGGANEHQNCKISASWLGSGSIDRLQFHTDIQALGTSLGWAV